MITAKYGDKKFEVSAKTIFTPNGLSFSEAIDIEEVEQSGKKPAMNIKSIKLKNMSFDLILDARFVTIATEIRWWEKTLQDQKSYDFTLGEVKIGKFFLNQVTVSEVNMNAKGVWTKAKIALSFLEDSGVKASPTSSSGGSSGEGGSYYSSGSAANAAAVKESVRTTNLQNFPVGTVVKPYGGARWYSTAKAAHDKNGSNKAVFVTEYVVSSVSVNYADVVYIKPKTSSTYSGWVRTEDIRIVPTPVGAKAKNTGNAVSNAASNAAKKLVDSIKKK